MPKFKFHVAQEFSCTYIAEGDSMLDAWANLINNSDAECTEQYPEQIMTELENAGVAILNEQTGDWKDVQ